VLVGAFAWALPRFADYGEVWSQLNALQAGVLPALAVVGAANLVAPSVSQMAALPGLRLRQAVVVDWTTTAVTNLLPGGSALAVGLTWSMYRSFSLTSAAIARSVVVTGVWDVLVKLGMPLVAVVWLASDRPVDAVVIQAAVVGAVLFAVALGLGAVVVSGPGTAARFGRLLNRLPGTGSGWPKRLERIRVNTVELLATRWRSLTFWTVAGHVNLYLLLVVCLRLVAVDRATLGWSAVLAAFAFGRLVTILPLTPGGLGVMEVGLVGALSALATPAAGATGTDAAIVGAVLLFRLASFALPLPLGLIGWIWWSSRSTAEPVRER
jgi:uncharacterized membrane protein YbhN (UPF0104 family)